MHQTQKNLEIILVDDGSPAGSSKKCDEWADRDSRVVVLHRANEGVSAARNAGMDAAHGDYLCFVDSDDAVEPQLAETAARAAATRRCADSLPRQYEMTATTMREHCWIRAAKFRGVRCGDC
ncbi:MAG: glycosyltransferase [Bifidobacterium sp.]